MLNVLNVIRLGNNQSYTFLAPITVGPYPIIDFAATNPAQPAHVILGGPSTAGQNSRVWTLRAVDGVGEPGHKVYGSVTIQPYYGSVVLQQGVALSEANVTFGVNGGGAGPFVFNGASTVTDSSVLTANGGRYASLGLGSPYVINGSMSVTNNSVANFANVTVKGPGTIHVGSGSTVDMQAIAAGLHVDVDKGGKLSLLYPNSTGTINESAGGAVFIGGATTATKEVFHEASGTLDLLNKSGAQVASLKFAPGSHEYTSTAPIHGGLLEITTNPMMVGNLHTTFTS
jgi:hypothetical protein